MESIFLLLILAPTALFLIFKFDNKQSRKVKKVLKDTNNIQPLFLLRAVENKLNELNTKLYGNVSLIANGVHSGRANINEGVRQMLTEQLSKVISEYNNGQLNLKDYNNKLGDLLETVNQVKHLNFEQIKS